MPTKDLKRKFDELMAKEIETVDEEQIKTPKEANDDDIEDVDVFVSLLPPGRMFHRPTLKFLFDVLFFSI